MQKENPWAAEVMARRIASRIREFQAERGLSTEALARAARLTDEEMAIVQEGRTDITLDMGGAIADVFNIHVAVLYMYPEENALTRFIEQYRDLPKDNFGSLLRSMTLSRAQSRADRA